MRIPKLFNKKDKIPKRTKILQEIENLKQQKVTIQSKIQKKVLEYQKVFDASS